MKQKLGLTCALIHTPQILLLDEPTTGVDPVSRRDFWRILYGLREEGVTIVIIDRLSGRSRALQSPGAAHGGRVLHCDTPAALKQRMPGALVVITSTAGRADARSVIAALEGVSSAILVGDGVHVVVDDARLRIPRIARRVAAGGLPFADIAVGEPSIEDVFVALLENDEADRMNGTQRPSRRSSPRT